MASIFNYLSSTKLNQTNFKAEYPNAFLKTYGRAFGSKTGDSDIMATDWVIYNTPLNKVAQNNVFGNSANATPTGSGGGFFSELGGAINKGFKFVAEKAGEMVTTQYGKDEKQDAPGEIINAFAKGGLNPMSILTNGLSSGYKAVTEELTKESKLLSEVNSKVGISGELSEGLRKDMLAASVEASAYGMTLEDIGDLYTTMNEKSGKFSLINKTLIDSAVPVATALSMNMTNFAIALAEFEKVGMGADSAIKQLDKTATNSISLGLSARKIAETIQTNIGKLNEYGFQNGYKGLERMVQKAYEFRMEMSSITAIADKVFSPEGAIELSANLQVLGGAMGDFNDPLKLMYEATNNVEGLQDALIGAAGGLATYNQEQGRFEITGVNLRKAKEMAGALGITMGELNKTAIAAAERSSATAALMGKGFDIPDKEKEFLINMSRMDGGEMKIVVPESLQEKFGKVTELALEDITEEQKNMLVQYQKDFEKMDSKSIAMAQLTETQQMVRSLDVMASYVRIRAAQMIKGGTEGALKNEFDDYRKKAEAYVGKLETNKIYTDEKDAKDYVATKIEQIKNIPTDIKNYIEELLGIKKPNQNANNNSNNNTQTIKHEIMVSSNSTFTDSFSRELARDNSLVTQWGDAAPNSMTTPNSAIRK